MNLSDVFQARVLVGDGAMGTELQRAGLPIGEPGERWMLDHPDTVQAIHAAYVAAGSEAIISNSFGANRWVLGRHGLEDKVESINRQAAAVARRAAGSSVAVLGDIGPFGGFLEPLGDTTVEELEAAFTQQARALLEGGADAIIIETMTALEEVKAAIRGARAAGAPYVIASLAFDRLPNGNIRTMMGVSPERGAAAMSQEGADAIGANCGTSMAPADFARVVSAFKGVTDKPVVIQANAGSPDLVDGRAVYRLEPDAFASAMREVIDAGARMVGGCCGTTPAHIAALASVVRTVASGL